MEGVTRRLGRWQPDNPPSRFRAEPWQRGLSARALGGCQAGPNEAHLNSKVSWLVWHEVVTLRASFGAPLEIERDAGVDVAAQRIPGAGIGVAVAWPRRT